MMTEQSQFAELTLSDSLSSLSMDEELLSFFTNDVVAVTEDTHQDTHFNASFSFNEKETSTTTAISAEPLAVLATHQPISVQDQPPSTVEEPFLELDEIFPDIDDFEPLPDNISPAQAIFEPSTVKQPEPLLKEIKSEKSDEEDPHSLLPAKRKTNSSSSKKKSVRPIKKQKNEEVSEFIETLKGMNSTQLEAYSEVNTLTETQTNELKEWIRYACAQFLPLSLYFGIAIALYSNFRSLTRFGFSNTER